MSTIELLALELGCRPVLGLDRKASGELPILWWISPSENEIEDIERWVRHRVISASATIGDQITWGRVRIEVTR